MRFVGKNAILKMEFDFILGKKYGKAPDYKNIGGFCSAT